MINTIIVIVIVLLVIAGAWFWYTHTPEYLAKKATDAARDAALSATGTNGVGLQRGVYDTMDAAEQQRRLGANVDPGVEGLKLVRNAYLEVATQWQHERSIDVSDPVQRINVMNNIAGMVEATVQLFVAAIPYITTQEGMDAAKRFYLTMLTDATDRRNCWWRLQSGCDRGWSVAEPHQNDRTLEEQNRLKDFSKRILRPLEEQAQKLHLRLFTPTQVEQIHQMLLGGTVAENPYDEATFHEIEGYLS